MADAVGVGMARRAQEIESARQQVLLEQAFSPAVVEHLRRHPEALAGRTREVTLLFADLRGFTGLAECLSPAEAYELLGAVMEQLTQAVMDHGGMVIDYYGDGLCALWNAPLDVPEHADLACTAAMHMLDVIPAVSDQWRARIGQALELGIGLHSGEVQVGNAGTRRRLKYGPRGSAVNLASRVQAATRQVDVTLLVTDAVRRRLSARFVTLKACTAKLPGLEQPVDLFTVFPATDGERLQEDLERYAVALAAFEEGNLDHAELVLSDLLASGPATPAAFLAQQAAALRQGALGRRATDQIGRSSDAVIEILAK
jgi:adenylate cyclase